MYWRPDTESRSGAAGLPVTPQRAATVTPALHAAVPHLLAGGPGALTAAGLDDLDRFVRGLLDTVYGPAGVSPGSGTAAEPRLGSSRSGRM